LGETTKRSHQFLPRYDPLQRGQSMAEYALIVALVVIVGVAGAMLGTNITGGINSVTGCI
jgi:Flp pilus assembly pilin Flp